MLRKTQKAKPPTGFKLKLFRAPLILYRLKLGFLLGNRFVRLGHWGRKTGRLNHTVLEVIDFDESSQTVFCASGFGGSSQWFKNVQHNPAVIISRGATDYAANATVLSPEQAEALLLRYANAHPASMKAVARLSGYEMDGSEADIKAFSRVIKIIGFALTQSSD